MKQIRQRLTYANVMSSLAVFLILGGATAFAAKKIGANEIKANSIKTGKIVKEAVTTGKLKKGAVDVTRLANNAVTADKLADNAVTTSKIADNAVTTAKLADKAVTASKINVTGLAQVPSADNANTVGGFAPSSLIRSAFAGSSTPVAVEGGGTGKTVLSTTITAPTNGYLLVTSNATWNASAANAVVHAGIDVDNPGVGTWPSDDSRAVSIQMGTATIVSGAPSARFAVGPGAHTIRLKAHNDGSGTLSFRGGSLTVLFEPFGGNGSPGNGTTNVATTAGTDGN